MIKKHKSCSRYVSPKTLKEKVLLLCWDTCWTIFCVWTPRPLNRWRVLWLKIFGAKIIGRPFVHQRARFHSPWNIELQNGSAVGDRANLYSLDKIIIGERSVVAQESYLCTGTHEFEDLEYFSLLTDKIIIEDDVFIGARAFILKGITVKQGAIVGSCSVVTKDVPEWSVSVGNPCRVIKGRRLNRS